MEKSKLREKKCRKCNASLLGSEKKGRVCNSCLDAQAARFSDVDEVIMYKVEQKKRLIRALAVYLVENQVDKSIELQSGKPSAQEWATLRGATPLFGYPTVEEAERELTELLA